MVLCSLLHQDWEALAWGTEIVGPKATTSTLGDEINCSVDAWQTWGGSSPTPPLDVEMCYARGVKSRASSTPLHLNHCLYLFVIV